MLKFTGDFEELEKFGFVEDAANCSHPQDTYYAGNNYYKYISYGDEFRIVVNMHTRDIGIFSMGCGLTTTHDIDTLYDLIQANLVEKCDG